MSEHYTDGLNKWINTFFTRELNTTDEIIQSDDGSAPQDLVGISMEYRAKKVSIRTAVNADARQDDPVQFERMDLKTVAAVYKMSRQEAELSGDGLRATVVHLLEDRCMDELDRQYRTWLYKRGEYPESWI